MESKTTRELGIQLVIPNHAEAEYVLRRIAGALEREVNNLPHPVTTELLSLDFIATEEDYAYKYPALPADDIIYLAFEQDCLVYDLKFNATERN